MIVKDRAGHLGSEVQGFTGPLQTVNEVFSQFATCTAVLDF